MYVFLKKKSWVCKEYKALFGFFFYHSSLLTQFSLLITHHVKHPTSFGTITYLSSLNIFQLFVGHIPVTWCNFYFFFSFNPQYPNSSNLVKKKKPRNHMQWKKKKKKPSSVKGKRKKEDEETACIEPSEERKKKRKEKKRKKERVKSCGWVWQWDPVYDVIYENAIENRVMETENTFYVFSVSIIYYSKIRELTDEKKKKKKKKLKTELWKTKQTFQL